METFHTIIRLFTACVPVILSLLAADTSNRLTRHSARRAPPRGAKKEFIP